MLCNTVLRCHKANSPCDILRLVPRSSKTDGAGLLKFVDGPVSVFDGRRVRGALALGPFVLHGAGARLSPRWPALTLIFAEAAGGEGSLFALCEQPYQRTQCSNSSRAEEALTCLSTGTDGLM